MGIDAEMFVRSKGDVTPAMVKRVAWEACTLFGRSRFFINRDPEYQRRALEIVDVYTQDGPDIVPEPGETFVRVGLSTRYWGFGYERGDLALILTLATWLEQKFPSSSVWYGGDSSGVLAEPLDAARRAALITHAASSHGLDYRMGHRLDPKQEDCDFCDAPMAQCLWNGPKVGFACSGCGLHRTVDGDTRLEAVGEWPK